MVDYTATTADQQQTTISSAVSEHLHSPVWRTSCSRCIVMWIVIIATFTGYDVTCYVIAKNECFHTPHFYFMIGYMVGDLMQVGGLAVPFLVILYTGANVPSWYCATIGVPSTIGFYTGMHILGVISAERYVFMCRPYTYG